VGKDAEHGGIAKHGAKLVNAVATASVPKLTVGVRVRVRVRVRVTLTLTLTLASCRWWWAAPLALATTACVAGPSRPV